MKTAVIYYSMSGNTRMVADKIASLLSAELIELKPVKAYPDKGFRKFIWGGKSAVMGEKPMLSPYNFDASLYDLIIFGSPVWASSFAPPLRTFIYDHKLTLKHKNCAAFLCYSGGGAEKAMDKLRDFLEIDRFKAELALIDPKNLLNTDNDRKIETFCSLLS